MNEDSIMPTGKYQGRRMAEVPAAYLLWIFDSRRWGRRRDLLIYLMEHEKELRKEARNEQRNTEMINELLAEINKGD